MNEIDGIETIQRLDIKPGGTDALAAALAAEEHRQGRPYLAEPEHCERCAEVDRTWEMATCDHDETVDITSFGQIPGSEVLCVKCGQRVLGDA